MLPFISCPPLGSFSEEDEFITLHNEAERHIDLRIARKLKSLRLLRGLNQSELAERVGLVFQQIQNYENGRSRIHASRLYRIAGVLGVDICSFFSDEADLLEREHMHGDAKKLLRIFANIREPALQSAFLDVGKSIEKVRLVSSQDEKNIEDLWCKTQDNPEEDSFITPSSAVPCQARRGGM